jgi:integral membrane protein (TIGR01906 family)
MRSMTAAETATPSTNEAHPGIGRGRRVVVFVGTILVIIMLAVLPLLTPWFIHAGLDAADSATRLGIEPEQAYAMSDLSVQELVLGPGEFDFAGPDGTAFYDADERGHLGDARTLLWLFLIAGGLSLIVIAAILARAPGIGKRLIWHTTSRAGLVTALTVVVLGVVSLVAFGSLFTLFHQVFFPAGNWAFDPSTQRLVQLYPFSFWRFAAAALGVLVLLLGVIAWLLGRTMARRTSDSTAP